MSTSDGAGIEAVHLTDGAGIEAVHLTDGAGIEAVHPTDGAGIEAVHLTDGAGIETVHLTDGAGIEAVHLISNASEDNLEQSAEGNSSNNAPTDQVQVTAMNPEGQEATVEVQPCDPASVISDDEGVKSKVGNEGEVTDRGEEKCHDEDDTEHPSHAEMESGDDSSEETGKSTLSSSVHVTEGLLKGGVDASVTTADLSEKASADTVSSNMKAMSGGTDELCISSPGEVKQPEELKETDTMDVGQVFTGSPELMSITSQDDLDNETQENLLLSEISEGADLGSSVNDTVDQKVCDSGTEPQRVAQDVEEQALGGLGGGLGELENQANLCTTQQIEQREVDLQEEQSGVQEQRSVTEDTFSGQPESENATSGQPQSKPTCPEQPESETICPEKPKSETICPPRLESETVCPEQLESESIHSEQSESEMVHVCPEQPESEIVHPQKPESETVCHQQSESDTVCRQQPESDKICSEQPESEIVCTEPPELDTVCPGLPESENDCPEKLGSETVCSHPPESEPACPEQPDSERVCAEEHDPETTCTFPKQPQSGTTSDELETEILSSEQLKTVCPEQQHESDTAFPKPLESVHVSPETPESDTACPEQQGSEDTCLEPKHESDTTSPEPLDTVSVSPNQPKSETASSEQPESVTVSSHQPESEIACSEPPELVSVSSDQPESETACSEQPESISTHISPKPLESEPVCLETSGAEDKGKSDERLDGTCKGTESETPDDNCAEDSEKFKGNILNQETGSIIPESTLSVDSEKENNACTESILHISGKDCQKGNSVENTVKDAKTVDKKQADVTEQSETADVKERHSETASTVAKPGKHEKREEIATKSQDKKDSSRPQVTESQKGSTEKNVMGVEKGSTEKKKDDTSTTKNLDRGSTTAPAKESNEKKKEHTSTTKNLEKGSTTAPVKSKETHDAPNTKTSKLKENSKESPSKDTSSLKKNQVGMPSDSPLKTSSLGPPKAQMASPGRDGKGPSKIERYSEQRQRKSASRAADRNERSKDGKSKQSSSGGKDNASANSSSSGGGGDLKATLPKVNMPTAAELEAQWQKEEEEKKRLEEERKKEEERLEEERLKEEERMKLEEEERLKAEEAQRQLQEELKLVDDYITEGKEKIENKASLREKNSSAAENRPDESFFTKLDSNLKKNTAFVKKLKNLTDSQKDSLIKDFLGLNLSKYIGECAAAIAEAKLKMSDVGCGVALSSLLYQRYVDFAPALLENWQKFLLNKKDEKIPNPSKYRVDLRFFAELVSAGVFTQKEGLHMLANQLSILITNDKEEHNNLSTITSFCKHCGDDYAGLVPRKIRELAEKHNIEIPRSGVLRPERQKACRNLLKDYYQSLCKHLTKDYKDLKHRERQNLRTLQTKGELSNEKKEAYEAALIGYQKLHGNTSTLADLLDEDMPDLPDEDFSKDPESAAFDVFNPMSNAEYKYEGDTTLFEDEETRSFYENLDDLKAFIPGILYKESEQATTKDATKDVDTGLEEESLQVEDVEKEMETEQSLAEIEQQAMEKELQENPIKEEEDETDLPPNITVPDDDEGETVSLMKTQFEAYIQSLPNCVNRELMDKAAIEFCMNFNTKSNRKKLVRALFTVHRTRYDLLPFYSRFVATLYPCMPDVANDLVHLLKGDFKWHVRKKDQINIESKLKTVRFIGEMVKFNMFPKSESLHCVKMLMFDFSHHNIEMACALLDTCGRYLYRSPESHHRTKVYLDVMMRKKAALTLEGRYTTMIENAYYYSNPPDTPQLVRKVRTPIQEYIRRLLYKDLSKTTTEKVLRQMRKLDWDDMQISFYATKCLTAVWNVRYNSVHCAANLLAGLAPYHEPVAIQVVDGMLEDVRLGMEINHPKYNQRRVSSVKYLGELYNYRMVESSVIFKTLYLFITFGVSLDEANPSPMDPPEHLFRMRLVCVLLDTCGQYFDKGSSKRKLDCFLVYFQRYYWFKRSCSMWTEDRPFPIDVKNMVQDTFETVRPKLKMQENKEEAFKAADDLDIEFKSKLANILPASSPSEDGDTSGYEDQGLSTIPESDEMEELSQSLSQTPLTDDGPSTVESETSQDESQIGSQAKSEDGGDDSSSGEEEDDVLESAGEDESEDQVTVLSGGPKFVNSTEDDDFMAAFDKMMTDNIQARNSEALKVPQLDIAVPVHLKSGPKKYAQLELPERDEGGAIKFVLMTRKGNKQQFSNLNVPISEEFAAKFKERERAERAEKEKMKQVVLGIHERQEQEDYEEMIAALNRPVPLNTNRERRVRYQHPRGAPDADAIFGSKKR